ncbi:phosphoribosyltransferase [Rhodopseudomonas palustris]
MTKIFRTPWASDFPAVHAQAPYQEMVRHIAYSSAKSGRDDEAALALVYHFMNDQVTQRIRDRLRGRKPRVVAVHAQEAQGRNKIPMAYAEILAAILGLDTDPGIVQASIANHSIAKSIYHRFASQPLFDGYVEQGVEYFIVDDVCTAGGTLANLKGFIEHSGGNVIGMSVLSLGNPRLVYDIGLSRPTLRQLSMRHPKLNDWWTEEFGHGIECLTEGEAGQLRSAPSFDTIRNRVAEARRDLDINADEGVDAGAPEPPEMVVGEAVASPESPDGR